MNLREEKHWAYGAYTFVPDALGQRPWLGFAPVQIDKTADALKEIDREFREYVGARPASSDELAKIQAIEIRSLPGAYETMASVADDDCRHRPLPPSGRLCVQAQGGDRSHDAGASGRGRQALDPAAMTWVVVGDLKQIEGPIRALGLGEVSRD